MLNFFEKDTDSDIICFCHYGKELILEEIYIVALDQVLKTHYNYNLPFNTFSEVQLGRDIYCAGTFLSNM